MNKKAAKTPAMSVRPPVSSPANVKRLAQAVGRGILTVTEARSRIFR